MNNSKNIFFSKNFSRLFLALVATFFSAEPLCPIKIPFCDSLSTMIKDLIFIIFDYSLKSSVITSTEYGTSLS